MEGGIVGAEEMSWGKGGWVAGNEQGDKEERAGTRTQLLFNPVEFSIN